MKGIQIVLEVIVIIGYALGLIPFGYMWSFWLVIPCLIISLLLSFMTGTVILVIGNLFLSFLSFIPGLGFIFRLLGICLSVLTIDKKVVEG